MLWAASCASSCSRGTAWTRSAPLIDNITFAAILADKAFDSNRILAEITDRGAAICISQRPNRKEPLQIDLELYKKRHLIENFFGKLKKFKRIALRADKTDTSLKAMIHATAAFINSH
jgi:transposase